MATMDLMATLLDLLGAENAPFLEPFLESKTIDLPRQARDKHRKHSKRGRLLDLLGMKSYQDRPLDGHSLVPYLQGKNTASFSAYCKQK
jgi:hypothetical protein